MVIPSTTEQSDGDLRGDEFLVGCSLDQLPLLVCEQPDLHPFRAALASAWRLLVAESVARTVLATRLKDEADRHWAIDPHISLRLARAIILLGYQTGDSSIIGLGRMARADAVRKLGQPRFALVLLARAAALFRECGDEVGWARTQISAMGAQISLGQLQDALDTASGARDVLVRHDEVLRLARLDSNTAYVHWQFGKPAVAIKQYDAVINMCKELATAEAEELVTQTRLNKGNRPESTRPPGRVVGYTHDGPRQLWCSQPDVRGRHDRLEHWLCLFLPGPLCVGAVRLRGGTIGL